MSLKKGDSLPQFTLKDQHGNTFNSTSLAGKPCVIYFYPKDYTPGCTAEACSFRDAYEDFVKAGAEVVGISGDSVKMHQKFAKTYRLPFVLLSDENRKVAKLFGVQNNLFGLLPGRETYVFDENGKVLMQFNSMNATKHIEIALAALKTRSK